MVDYKAASAAYHDPEKADFLPPIDSREAQNMTALESLVHNKKDFFKLGLHQQVQYEQNDQTMKRLYAKKINKKFARRFKSQLRSKGGNVTPLYAEKDFGDLDTDYDPMTANQRLNKEHLIRERFK